MTHTKNIEKEYFEWMYDLVCFDRFAKNISYKYLLKYLHNTEFTYTIKRDSNRFEDGLDLRRRFAREKGYRDVDRYSFGGCSIFEMMLALAIRCEETIMDDARIGDRTAQWFWRMITNLGLGAMTDERFDMNEVENIVMKFLNRKYDPDGRGGLFMRPGIDCDRRRKEIWTQMCYFLDSIT